MRLKVRSFVVPYIKQTARHNRAFAHLRPRKQFLLFDELWGWSEYEGNLNKKEIGSVQTVLSRHYATNYWQIRKEK